MDAAYWSTLILAIAISIDGFSVGITYGLRGIKMGVLSLLIISFISSISIYLTSTLGAGIANILNRELAELFGSIILILIGSWLVYSAYLNYNGNSELKEKKLLVSLQIKSLGIIIKILKEPVKADFDRSGTINYSEAFFLGLALALDALGAGLGAGLSGLSNIFFPLIIGVINLIFVGGGFFIGRKAGNVLPEHFEIYPGLLIVLLGVIKLF